MRPLRALRALRADILNVNLSHERAWLQASGPSSVFRGPCQFAPSAFLASATGCSALVEEIVGSSNASTQHADMECAIAFWHEGHSEQPPSTLHSSCQHFWDAPCAVSTYNMLLQEAPDSQTKLRPVSWLLHAQSQVPGSMYILPIAALCLRLSDDVVRTAVGLRLGASLC